MAAIEAEFGRPLNDIFASFEAAPLASGSIAQIHVATLRDPNACAGAAGAHFGGLRKVAVKVQHPGAWNPLLEKRREVV